MCEGEKERSISLYDLDYDYDSWNIEEESEIFVLWVIISGVPNWKFDSYSQKEKWVNRSGAHQHDSHHWIFDISAITCSDMTVIHIIFLNNAIVSWQALMRSHVTINEKRQSQREVMQSPGKSLCLTECNNRQCISFAGTPIHECQIKPPALISV